MKKYIITIEETIVQDFEIEAESPEEAFEMAEKSTMPGSLCLSRARCKWCKLL